MMYENDKLIIPEKYRKMSVSELKREKEKVYTEIRKKSSEERKKKVYKNETIMFRF